MNEVHGAWKLMEDVFEYRTIRINGVSVMAGVMLGA